MRWMMGVGVVAMTACLGVDTVPCGDDVCPSGRACVELASGETTCVLPEQQVGCVDAGGAPFNEGLECQRDGRCRRGICVAKTCGDGTKEVGEICEGADLGGATCASIGAGYAGTVSCSDACTLVTSACVGRCGDGIVDEIAGEACEAGVALDATCASIGAGYQGTLGCSGCQLDPSGCSGSCGDGTIDAAFGELCEGADLGGATCASIGAGYRGELACTAACTYESSGCAGRCGDGVLDPEEVCDTVAAEDSCLAYGFDVGRVTCGDACTPDFAACSRLGWTRLSTIEATDLAVVDADRLALIVDGAVGLYSLSAQAFSPLTMPASFTATELAMFQGDLLALGTQPALATSAVYRWATAAGTPLSLGTTPNAGQLHVTDADLYVTRSLGSVYLYAGGTSWITLAGLGPPYTTTATGLYGRAGGNAWLGRYQGQVLTPLATPVAGGDGMVLLAEDAVLSYSNFQTACDVYRNGVRFDPSPVIGPCLAIAARALPAPEVLIASQEAVAGLGAGNRTIDAPALRKLAIDGARVFGLTSTPYQLEVSAWSIATRDDNNVAAALDDSGGAEALRILLATDGGITDSVTRDTWQPINVTSMCSQSSGGAYYALTDSGLFDCVDQNCTPRAAGALGSGRRPLACSGAAAWIGHNQGPGFGALYRVAGGVRTDAFVSSPIDGVPDALSVRPYDLHVGADGTVWIVGAALSSTGPAMATYSAAEGLNPVAVGAGPETAITAFVTCPDGSAFAAADGAIWHRGVDGTFTHEELVDLDTILDLRASPTCDRVVAVARDQVHYRGLSAADPTSWIPVRWPLDGDALGTAWIDDDLAVVGGDGVVRLDYQGP